MRPVPAKLKRDLRVIRCARARRGGQPCTDYPCECIEPWRLLAQAGPVLRPFLGDRRPTAAQRAALEDWMLAATQEEAEWSKCDETDIGTAVIALTGLQGSSTLRAKHLADMDLLCMYLRWEDETTPAPTALVVAAIAWAKANLCRPRPEVRAARAAKTSANARAGFARRAGKQGAR